MNSCGPVVGLFSSRRQAGGRGGRKGGRKVHGERESKGEYLYILVIVLYLYIFVYRISAARKVTVNIDLKITIPCISSDSL